MQISLELDNELSQLERRMRRTHLERCAECRDFESSVRAFTSHVRATPLGVPSRPVVVSRAASRRLRWLSQRQIASAGSAAMILFGVLGVASQVQRPEVRPQPPIQQQRLFEATWSPDDEQAQLVTGAPKRWRVGTRHGGVFTS